MSDSNTKDSIVERRMRYIERQKEMKPNTVNVKFAGRKPEGSGPTNRHGMPKLPSGQREVKNWPVLDIGHVPNVSKEDWRLEIDGEVENPTTLDWNAFLELPQVEDVSDFHCVTTWSRYDNRWNGVRFKTLAELVVPTDKARFVLCEGYDQLQGSGISYTTNLPLERAVEDDVLLVHRWEGEPLPKEHGGPVRMITPKLYAWKGTKWIKKITFLSEDHPGFWEVRGYSNSAEPWFNDRYSD
ncbi:MAG: sulfite oxidase-like oxidoreductase [Candidatus Eisenbacteria bacterium]|uniref:Sulfite oxidase-like oxidoreductase n=1 Tax=Eiseniibacteriota bacterium TaxID=2212470 RepID=A0A7Y2H0P8_UNCEI|nr:sulfite oxidase-like oxidoreductase [Candidatus Eisenbacteria bacterium]